ncbi:MAG: CDP-diacylglycerol--glycerol-3-phosphate 3-phosphatidyltransferase [Oscillospiraceae bacterium]|nr:CDP-diacylglycerol--glycerol-3-phosphate 3-phosphatidyltransferase [Oscillospiraceae bacterium]
MLKTTANKITMLRVVLVPVFMVLAYSGSLTAAFIVYVVACLSDFVDGYIARHYNQTSDFGKFADPLADKMLVVAALCFFTDKGQMPGWIVAAVVFREFAVSGLRLSAAVKNRVIAAAWSGKIKTACTMVGLGAMMLFPKIKAVNTAVSIVILITTLYSGVEYFIKNIDILKD